MVPTRSLGSALAYLALAVAVSLITQLSWVSTLFDTRATGIPLALTLIGAIALTLSRYATPILPTFVWAILFGMALQYPLSILTGTSGAFQVSIDLLGAFVLFASGLMVPVKNFKRYFAPIAALSVIGTMIGIIAFAFLLGQVTAYAGMTIPSFSLIILAAILSSIDPTAILPSLEQLHLKRPFLKDIALSESALNDAVGVILTRVFLVAAVGVGSMHVMTTEDSLAALFSRSLLEMLSLELFWGSLVGLLGYFILKVWGESVRTIHWSDPALFGIVPIFSFALGSIVGAGAGFLAAFIAGLLYETHAHTQDVRQFFDRTVNHVLKPAIFVLLGAITPLDMLLDLLPLGVAASLIFMLVIRPLVVALSLIPWSTMAGSYLSWRDAIFLSTIRETGAVPAILLMSAMTFGLVGSEFIFAIGVWVIICTLIIEPPLSNAILHYFHLNEE